MNAGHRMNNPPHSCLFPSARGGDLALRAGTLWVGRIASLRKAVDTAGSVTSSTKASALTLSHYRETAAHEA